MPNIVKKTEAVIARYLLVFFIVALPIMSEAQNLEQQNAIFSKEKFNAPALSPLNFLPTPSSVPPALRAYIKRLSNLSDQKPAALCPKSELGGLTALQTSNKRGLRDEAWFLAGIVHDLCGDLELARSHYKTSLKLRRNNPNLLFLAGLLEFKLGHPDQGKVFIEEAAWLNLKDQYLVKYLLGLHAQSKGSSETAIKHYESALLAKPDFLPALMESYTLFKEMRGKAGSEKEIVLRDAQIAAKLSLLTRLSPLNRQFATEYLRYLLVTGDPVNSPTKLAEAEVLANSWLKRSDSPDDEMFLYKIQILEKRGKKSDALDLIIEREKAGIPLSPTLQVKKTQLSEKSKEEE